MSQADIDYHSLSLSPLFVGLNQDELVALVEAAEMHEIEGNDIVVNEGDPGEAMYLLHDGEVVIEKKANGGDTIELTRLHRRGISSARWYLWISCRGPRRSERTLRRG